MTWQDRNVLVTGAGGFIGSHLAERLVREDANVQAFIEYNRQASRGWLEESDHAEEIDLVLGDIRDPGQVRDAVTRTDTVFHLAALIGIPYSYRAPSTYVDTNVGGTLSVLEACRREHVEALVYTSTSEVYGTARTVPIDESHPLQAQSPYAATKIGAEKMVESYRHSFDLPVVTLRPFNTFGPRQSARAVIPTIITQALARDRVELGSLHPTRDFNYVANTVDGLLLAGTVDDAVGRTLNLGTGREVSIGELAELIVDLIGRPVEIESTRDRQRPERSEVDRLLADATQARDVLDWEPRVDLENGLHRTIEWTKEHLDAYDPESYAI